MAKLQVLFEGTDSLNHQSLWVTDGTAAGTSELASAGAYSGGLFYNFSPQFAALGTKVLVDGYDSANRRGLWVTDGTSAGVSELAVTGAYSGGLFSGIDPQFGVFGTEVLFKGYDTSSHLNLWITDGTSAGTSELAVAGGNSGGLFATVTDPSFTVLGSKVLFEGYDSGSKRSLWVTDGTVAGTSEVQVAGAYTGGLWSSGNPNFVVLAAKHCFPAMMSVLVIIFGLQTGPPLGQASFRWGDRISAVCSSIWLIPTSPPSAPSCFLRVGIPALTSIFG
jgi:ELWxxDGT repeat protein